MTFVATPSLSPADSTRTTDLDAVFRLYHWELNRFAYRKLGDREAAADIVQEAFVRYLAADFDGKDRLAPASPRFFLWRIVGNLTIDLARRDRRRGAHASLDDVAAHLIDPCPTPERQLEARQEFLIVKRALDALPGNCRAALLLNRVEGLSHAEIGARLGVSASMVSKYIMSALRHCLAHLAQARA